MSETGRPQMRAVIMAGGSGTRFWPLSRRSRPKQFLPIATPRPMIVETVERLLPLLPYESIYTISNRSQAAMIRSLVPGLPARHVLVEPMSRNTAASLILATARVYRQNPGAVVFALPADHLIARPDVFRRKLVAAAEAAAGGEVIVTFGIPPTFPATGFGYIHYSSRNTLRIKDEVFCPVLRFKEKPDLERARKFLRQGRHAWNSGMFIWRADVFARKLKQHAPDFYPFWQRILKALGKKDRGEIGRVFREIPATSIDYALMERARGVLMNEGDFGWSDVGSWAALADIWPKDEAGNSIRGESLVLDARRCLIYSPRRMAAVVGLDDIIVVDTEDALLICRKERDQAVKDIIESLRKRGGKKYL
jgi:mannose-1-phosphate guanylyltransferase